jgi:hypothetical protein
MYFVLFLFFRLFFGVLFTLLRTLFRAFSSPPPHLVMRRF